MKFGVIMDVEASRAIRQAEVGAAKTMVERTEERFDIKPKLLAADTAYGSGSNLNWLVNDKDIEPHIPVIDKSKRQDGTFSREDFTFDKKRNVYTCPAGKTLKTTGKVVNDGETILYRASTLDCGPCPLKPQCCPKTPERKVTRSIYEEARDVARALAKTAAFAQSCCDRKRVEMLFAHLKRILKLGRLRRDNQDETRSHPDCRATVAFGYAARAVHRTSSPSQLSHKTYAASPNSSFGHHRQSARAWHSCCGCRCRASKPSLQWGGSEIHNFKTIDSVSRGIARRLMQQNRH